MKKNILVWFILFCLLFPVIYGALNYNRSPIFHESDNIEVVSGFWEGRKGTVEVGWRSSPFNWRYAVNITSRTIIVNENEIQFGKNNWHRSSGIGE